MDVATAQYEALKSFLEAHLTQMNAESSTQVLRAFHGCVRRVDSSSNELER
ncbi:28699_t:CDS:2, partial [Dentiscutata erythropus]